MKNYIKLIRPHHYIKNLLVFFPLIFSGRLSEGSLLVKNLLAFAAFCFAASVVYIFNDIKDADADRLNESKKNRPIAGGKISIKSAVILAAVLFAVSVAINFAIPSSLWAWAVFALYYIINAGYSLCGLKHVALLDIALLTAGFFIRVMYGAAVTDITISSWLYLTVIAISFYFSLGKRRNEALTQSPDGARKVLRCYSQGFLDKSMYMCLGLAVVFYSLWCVDPQTVERHCHSGAVWTVPLVLIMAMKYSMDVEGSSDGDPVEIIVHDKALLALGALYAACMYYIVYGF
ncbi:MAG: decaprenyl-phosphate phosphoribosyltransferase [Clostridia bacterium]|nr:decaprenyl-phosphate phosphoribosyltransferase [Clostridia bacterium]